MVAYEVRVAQETWNDEVGILLASRVDSLRRYLLYPMPELREAYDGEQIEPSLRISLGTAQNLADALAVAGFAARTADPKRVEGELAATKFHLEDMRKLVFK